MTLPNKLRSARLTLTNKGIEIPAALGALEGAVADIVGILTDVNVTLGLGMDNSGVLTNALIEQKAAAPVGFRLRDATAGTEFRMVNDGTNIAFDKNTGTEAAPVWTNLLSGVIATGVFTFLAFPITPSAAPTTDYQVANRKFVTDNAVALTGNQTLAGIKTFTSFPITPSSSPTTSYQVANKQYVDNQGGLAHFWAKVSSAGVLGVNFNVASVSHLGTGHYRVTLTTPFSSANWAAVIEVAYDASSVRVANPSAFATNYVEFYIRNSGDGVAEDADFYIMGFGT